jgi:hypothetical protein
VLQKEEARIAQLGMSAAQRSEAILELLKPYLRTEEPLKFDTKLQRTQTVLEQIARHLWMLVRPLLPLLIAKEQEREAGTFEGSVNQGIRLVLDAQQVPLLARRLLSLFLTEFLPPVYERIEEILALPPAIVAERLEVQTVEDEFFSNKAPLAENLLWGLLDDSGILQYFQNDMKALLGEAVPRAAAAALEPPAGGAAGAESESEASETAPVSSEEKRLQEAVTRVNNRPSDEVYAERSLQQERLENRINQVFEGAAGEESSGGESEEEEESEGGGGSSQAEESSGSGGAGTGTKRKLTPEQEQALAARHSKRDLLDRARAVIAGRKELINIAKQERDEEEQERALAEQVIEVYSEMNAERRKAYLDRLTIALKRQATPTDVRDEIKRELREAAVQERLKRDPSLSRLRLEDLEKQKVLHARRVRDIVNSWDGMRREYEVDARTATTKKGREEAAEVLRNMQEAEEQAQLAETARLAPPAPATAAPVVPMQVIDLTTESPEEGDEPPAKAPRIIEGELKPHSAKQNDRKRLKQVAAQAVTFYVTAPCRDTSDLKYKPKVDSIGDVARRHHDLVSGNELQNTRGDRFKQRGWVALKAMSQQQREQLAQGLGQVVDSVLGSKQISQTPSALRCPMVKKGQATSLYNQAIVDMDYFLVDLLFTYHLVVQNQELQGIKTRLFDNLSELYDLFVAEARANGIAERDSAAFFRAWLAPPGHSGSSSSKPIRDALYGGHSLLYATQLSTIFGQKLLSALGGGKWSIESSVRGDGVSVDSLLYYEGDKHFHGVYTFSSIGMQYYVPLYDGTVKQNTVDFAEAWRKSGKPYPSVSMFVSAVLLDQHAATFAAWLPAKRLL